MGFYGFCDTGPSTIIIKKEGLAMRLYLAGIKVGSPQSNHQLPILKSANEKVICVSIHLTNTSCMKIYFNTFMYLFVD